MAITPTLPYQDPNNQNNMLPLQFPAAQPPKPGTGAPQIGNVAPVGQVNTQVGGLANQTLQTAQQKALQGFDSPLQQQLQQSAMNLLQNPQTQQPGYVNQQLESLRNQQAKQYETARQGMAPVAGSAPQQRDLLRTAMDNMETQGRFKSDLDQQQADSQRKALLDAMATGQDVLKQQADIWQKPIDLLLKSRETAEPELARGYQAAENAMNRGMEIAKANQSAELQTLLTNISEAGQTGRLLSQQDFQTTQAELDRLQAQLLQKGDITGALDLEKLRGEISTQQQAAEQKWATGERVASEGWKTGERISSQDYDTTKAYLQQKFDLAKQEKDIDAQKFIADQQMKLQLAMQTAGFSQQEKMAYLGAQLDEAKANNDVARQETILTFQHGQEMEKILLDQGFQKSMDYNQQKFQTAMQGNDFVQAQAMLKLQQTFQADQAGQDRALEQTRIALQKAGVDMAKFEQTYKAMLDADPAAAFNYLQQQIAPLGIKLTAKDATTKAKEALAADFEAQKYQWGLTHRDPILVDQKTGELTQEGLKQFTTYFNTNVLGENATDYNKLVKGMADIADLRGGADPAAANHDDYMAVVAKAQQWTPQLSYDSGGWFGVDSRTITNVPAKNSLIKYDGGVYQVISDKSMRTSGQNTETFKVIDVNTGETRTIYVEGLDNSLTLKGFPGTPVTYRT